MKKGIIAALPTETRAVSTAKYNVTSLIDRALPRDIMEATEDKRTDYMASLKEAKAALKKSLDALVRKNNDPKFWELDSVEDAVDADPDRHG